MTNKVSPPSPVYVSSVIENASPAPLEMTYNLSLANTLPAAAAFGVQINGVNRNVSSIAISANKVRLTLASAVVFGDDVTVSYNKPASNFLQTPPRGAAASITSQSVTNNSLETVTIGLVGIKESKIIRVC